MRKMFNVFMLLCGLQSFNLSASAASSIPESTHPEDLEVDGHRVWELLIADGLPGCEGKSTEERRDEIYSLIYKHGHIDNLKYKGHTVTTYSLSKGKIRFPDGLFYQFVVTFKGTIDLSKMDIISKNLSPSVLSAGGRAALLRFKDLPDFDSIRCELVDVVRVNELKTESARRIDAESVARRAEFEKENLMDKLLRLGINFKGLL